MLFLMFALVTLSSIAMPVFFPSFSHPWFFWVVTGVAGFSLGYGGLLVTNKLKNTVLVGFVTLILAFGGLGGLFSYVFQLFTEPVPFIVMGTVLGSLVFRMIDLARQGEGKTE